RGSGLAAQHRYRLELAGGHGRLLVSVGLDLRGRLCLEREGVDRSADLRAEDLVDEAVLLDARESVERIRGRGEVIPATGGVLHLGARPRDGGLDALLYVLGRGHLAPSVEDRQTLSGAAARALYFGKSWSHPQEQSDDRDHRQGCREGARVSRLPAGGRERGRAARGRARRGMLRLPVPARL